MVAYYHVYDDFCKLGDIKGDLDRFIVDYLCELIDDD